MRIIHGVIASTGDREEYEEWIVRTFSNKDVAEQFVKDLNASSQDVRNKLKDYAINNIHPSYPGKYTDAYIEALAFYQEGMINIRATHLDPKVQQQGYYWEEMPHYKIIEIEFVE